MTITYNISNATPILVKTVMVRKFFQMVFMGNDRRSLNIYTATVIGGRKEKEDCGLSASDFCSTAYVSQLNELRGFKMRFEFVVSGNDNNDVMSIQSRNLTTEDRDPDSGKKRGCGEDKGFLSQIECIRQVWGNECEVIHNDQARLVEKLKSYLPKKGGENEDVLNAYEITEDQTAALAHEKVLYIHDKRKLREGEMCALAYPGEFLSGDDYIRCPDHKKREKVLEGSERSSYSIQVPQEVELVPGMELVNWVKTTIRFRHPFQDSNLNFCICKETALQNNVRYISSDFTWYFSPPVKAFIDNESSSAELKLIAEAENLSVESCRFKKAEQQGAENGCSLKCPCPVRQSNSWDHTTKRYPNVINPVANKTTVNFIQWTKDEMIGYRQKYRLAAKNIFTRAQSFDSVSEINIFLDTTDDHGRQNRQFVLGIFISFALAFGIDSTRLQAAERFFPFPGFLQADAWWLVLLTLLSLNLLIRPLQEGEGRWYYRWRKANTIFTGLWMIYVFILSKSQCLKGIQDWVCVKTQGFIPPFVMSKLPLVMPSLYVIFAVSNLLYIWRNIKKFHDPILSGLFNDDIL